MTMTACPVTPTQSHQMSLTPNRIIFFNDNGISQVGVDKKVGNVQNGEMMQNFLSNGAVCVLQGLCTCTCTCFFNRYYNGISQVEVDWNVGKVQNGEMLEKVSK